MHCGICIIKYDTIPSLYDIVYIFGHPIGWYQSTAGYVWEQFICWSFILLSGFFFVRKPSYQKGLLVLGAGCIISVVTMFVMPEQRVRFGILSLIGCCMLLTRLCLPVLKRILPEIGILICFALFCFTKALPFGGFGWGDTVLIPLPDWGMLLSGCILSVFQIRTFSQVIIFRWCRGYSFTGQVGLLFKCGVM